MALPGGGRRPHLQPELQPGSSLPVHKPLLGPWVCLAWARGKTSVPGADKVLVVKSLVEEGRELCRATNSEAPSAALHSGSSPSRNFETVALKLHSEDP